MDQRDKLRAARLETLDDRHARHRIAHGAQKNLLWTWRMIVRITDNLKAGLDSIQGMRIIVEKTVQTPIETIAYGVFSPNRRFASESPGPDDDETLHGYFGWSNQIKTKS